MAMSQKVKRRVNGIPSKKKMKLGKGTMLRVGMRGDRAKYMSKQTVMAKLQMNESDFMRLCIFKGVHPRTPKKKWGFPGTIYYHQDDFAFLKQDDLIYKFREMKTFDRKLAKYMHKKMMLKAKGYKQRCEPYYSLARVVKERYPTFEHAVKDSLDDALNTLTVIARLQVDAITEVITGERIAEAKLVLDQFYFIITKLGLIEKGFISKKGIYFGMKIDDIPIMWIIPHQASIYTEGAIDYTLIDTYAEFYVCLVKFVVFRLFTQAELCFPPRYRNKERPPCGWLAMTARTFEEQRIEDEKHGREQNENDAVPVIPEGKQSKKQLKYMLRQQKDEEAQRVAAEIEALRLESLAAERQVKNNVFKGCNVYINQEIPLTAAALILVSGGAQVSWYESPSDPIKYSPHELTSPLISHHIIDRPKLPKAAESFAGRRFIRPQWIFDCINSTKLLATAPYELGVPLPPHMSPFVPAMKTAEELEADKEAEMLEANPDEEKLLRMSMMNSKNRYTYKLLGLQASEERKRR